MIITPPPLVLKFGIALSFVGFSTSSTSTISPHANAAAGDIAVLFDYAKASASNPTSVTPSGWTTDSDDPCGGGSVFARLVISHQILAGTGSVTGMNPDIGSAKVMAVFRPSSALTSAIAQDVSSVDDSDGLPNQTVTASGGMSPLIVLGCVCNFSAGTGMTFSPKTPAWDAETMQSSHPSSYVNNRVGYKIYNSAPADHTFGNSGGNNTQYVAGLYIEAA